MLKISKIIIICITIISSVVGVFTVYKVIKNKRAIDQQLVYEQIWLSKDQTCSINIPKSWKIMRIESIIAQDSATGTLISASITNERHVTLKSLLNMAVNNVMLMSEDRCNLVETHVGSIGKYPSAWLLAKSNEVQAEATNFMVFAFNTPDGVYMIEFMMIPDNSLKKIRPIIEHIARSFKVVNRKQAYFDKGNTK